MAGLGRSGVGKPDGPGNLCPLTPSGRACYKPPAVRHSGRTAPPRTGAMIRRGSPPLAVGFLAWGLALTAATWVGAYLLRFSGLFPVTKDQPDFALCLHNLPMLLA